MYLLNFDRWNCEFRDPEIFTEASYGLSKFNVFKYKKKYPHRIRLRAMSLTGCHTNPQERNSLPTMFGHEGKKKTFDML